MAMLAGPRRKQKVINLRAKNNAWSNDSNKFGQRMLEKMGWSSGKGLGAKENGIVEHVVARYKNDEKGLGFEDKNDQWTKHEDDFNALLANLSNAESTEEKLHSGVSLEVKSKRSKARVHYHKFTRGKDLTRYSEKDLANIFGKKSLKGEKTEKAEEPPKEDEVKSSEQVFTEKGSMEDYFKSKLANFKSKCNLNFSKNEPDDNAEYAFKGFSGNADESDDNDKTSHQGFGFSFYDNSTAIEKGETNSNEVIEPEEDEQKLKKKKKKKSKNKSDDVQEESNITEQVLSEYPEMESSVQNITEEVPKSEKKKKKKKFLDETDQSEETKPKKKSKNNETSCLEEITPDTQDVEQENYVPKKKKKRKNKDKNE